MSSSQELTNSKFGDTAINKEPALITTEILEFQVTAPLFSLGVSAGDTEAVQKKTRKNAML